MESKSEPDIAKNEALRKIGRNILLFQKMELLLKKIIIISNLSGYVSEFESLLEQRKQNYQRQTMGQLVGHFLKNSLSECEEITDEPAKLKEIYLSFSYKIQNVETVHQDVKQALELVISERNELVHHLLSKFNFDISPVKNWLEIDSYLDEQHNKVIPHFDFLKGIFNSIVDTTRIYAAFVSSKEGEKIFKLLCLKCSHLTELLQDIESNKAGKDGWTLMNTAAQIVRQRAPEEIADMKKRYGHKKLKQFILATELFDIKEEPTDKGGTRVFYRSKPDSVI